MSKPSSALRERLDFSRRARGEEMMDDFSIDDARLHSALDELRWVNRLLGGYRALTQVLDPYLRLRAGRPVRLLDLGTGIADIPEYLVRWAGGRGYDLSVTAIDANPATVTYAKEALDRRLDANLRARITLRCADALDEALLPERPDVVTASMFLHHLDDEAGAALLRRMQELGRDGFVANDLQRHPLAYLGIQAIVKALPVSAMVAHDGPLSVLRGFRREELAALARAAGLDAYQIRWHWAFRWTLSTLPSP